MQEYIEKLRRLVDDYYYQQISFEEYRRQRKFLLDEIDGKFNHVYRKNDEIGVMS